MSQSPKASKVADCGFKWGKKRGIGGLKKEVQFYQSFTYDNDKYTLYDNVYLHKEGEPEPYIGKLVKIWEQPKQKKKVKVLWFFRPDEILNWLDDGEILENEILLASGDGIGLADVNPLESIAGRCHVVCTSKDSRNRQPSLEELRMADYIYYRTFNVDKCSISDKLDDKIAGVDVKFLLNKGGEQFNGVVKLSAVEEEGNRNVMASNEVSQLCPKLNSPGTLVDAMTDDHSMKAKLKSCVKLAEDNSISPSLAVDKDKNGNILEKKQKTDSNENDRVQASGTVGSAYNKKTKAGLGKCSLKIVKPD